MLRHCIITPEIGPVFKNGGVATNALHLARFIAARSDESVTIMHTGTPRGSLDGWQKFFKEEVGCEYFGQEDLPKPYSVNGVVPAQLAMSLRVFWWLRERSFDVVHAMQFEAAAFVSLQGRRLGMAFPRTHFITILNSPSRWLREGQSQPDAQTPSLLVLEHMEKYCIEHSDSVLSPSHAMLDWLRALDWKLPPDTRWLPTYSPHPEQVSNTDFGRSHIVFFGRLEVRKGLLEFLEAISRLPSRLNGQMPQRLRISLVGRCNHGSESELRNLIDQHLCTTRSVGFDGFDVEVLTTLDHMQAMEFLHANPEALYVQPSRLDNFPNAVREVQLRGLPQICADSPGVAEMFACNAQLFQPGTEGLLTKLEEIFRAGLRRSQPACTGEAAARMRSDYYGELKTSLSKPKKLPVHSQLQPLVSVCVAHHNLQGYLPQTLASLARLTYSRLEIVVVDDGSTSAEALAGFKQQRELYQYNPGWIFLESRNRGLCAARNFAAANSTGKYLVFVDADNLPFPNMIDVMVSRLEAADLDCLTCYLYAFDDGESEHPSSLRLFASFAGGCLPAALHRNTLGDANMIIKRSVFEAINGFRSSRDETSSDRALLIRLLRAGFKLDCTPECLFAYRRRPDSMSRQSSGFWRQLPIVDAFTEGMDPWVKEAILCKPTPVPEASRIDCDYIRALEEKVKRLSERHMEERMKRRERDRKADERYESLRRWRSNAYVRFGRFLGIVNRDY